MNRRIQVGIGDRHGILEDHVGRIGAASHIGGNGRSGVIGGVLRLDGITVGRQGMRGILDHVRMRLVGTVGIAVVADAPLRQIFLKVRKHGAFGGHEHHHGVGSVQEFVQLFNLVHVRNAVVHHKVGGRVKHHDQTAILRNLVGGKVQLSDDKAGVGQRGQERSVGKGLSVVGGHAGNRRLRTGDGKNRGGKRLFAVICPGFLVAGGVEGIEVTQIADPELGSEFDNHAGGCNGGKRICLEPCHRGGVADDIVVLNGDIIRKFLLQLESGMVHVILRVVALQGVRIVAEDQVDGDILILVSAVARLVAVLDVEHPVFLPDLFHHFYRGGAVGKGIVTVADKVDALVRQGKKTVGGKIHIPQELLGKCGEDHVDKNHCRNDQNGKSRRYAAVAELAAGRCFHFHGCLPAFLNPSGACRRHAPSKAGTRPQWRYNTVWN